MLLALLIVSGIAGIVLLPLLGARLLPDFRENYLIAHASLRPGIAIAETARIGEGISKALARIPGVKSVAEQIGRAENGQDPDTPNKSEFEVQIDPQKGHTAADIDAAIRDVFDDYPNQLVEIYSVLAERIGETLSGESAPFSVSVFGADLDVDDKVAGEIADVLRKLRDSGNRAAGRAAARAGASRFAEARSACALRLAGGRRARRDQRGVPRQPRRADPAHRSQRAGRVAHRGGRIRSACGRRVAACAVATARWCRSQKSPISRRSPRAA